MSDSGCTEQAGLLQRLWFMVGMPDVGRAGDFQLTPTEHFIGPSTPMDQDARNSLPTSQVASFGAS